MVLVSTISIAKVETKSLRATVPEGIVSHLKIQVGHKLEWRMDNQNNQRIAIDSRKRFGKELDSSEAVFDARLKGKQTKE